MIRRVDKTKAEKETQRAHAAEPVEDALVDSGVADSRDRIAGRIGLEGGKEQAEAKEKPHIVEYARLVRELDDAGKARPKDQATVQECTRRLDDHVARLPAKERDDIQEYVNGIVASQVINAQRGRMRRGAAKLLGYSEHAIRGIARIGTELTSGTIQIIFGGLGSGGIRAGRAIRRTWRAAA